ncbi:hypothetical protein V6N12_066795, partial [Hibiscus sabdariffa]
MPMFDRISSHYSSLLLSSFLLLSSVISTALSYGVINVKCKFAGTQRSLLDLKDHDSRRQLRILAGVDLPLGGSGRLDGVGLYYAKIGIGTPAKDYYVQVDTGSDLMWVNCIQCEDCPKRSSLGIDLTLYNIKDSATGKLVSCEQEFCHVINGGPLSGCTANASCPYLEIYGDGSSTAGYFVKDVVLYDRVSGDLKTSSANGSVIFGCGATQSGNLDSSNEEALDGILGFGKSNTSMISQLASSGKVKKMFAHCLDGINGGGIFAIGHVVQPKVNMTSLATLQYSGTTLAYLPEIIYEPLVSKILSQQPHLKLQTVNDDYKCFQYTKSLDDAFPNVTFHFEKSVILKVHPHDYLFPYFASVTYESCLPLRAVLMPTVNWPEPSEWFVVHWMAKQRTAIQGSKEYDSLG